MRANDQSLAYRMVILLRRFGFGMLALLFVIAACLAIAMRGPWYDEFYAFYVVRPGASLDVLAPAWLRDNHPPLFYGLAWLWGRVLGLFGLADSVGDLRTVNLVVLAATALLFARLARTDAWFRRLLWYDVLALAATFPALDRIDQLRSYFLSFALTALVLPIVLRWSHRGSRPAMPCLLLALAFTTHLVTTVIVMAMVAVMLLRLVLEREWQPARRLAMATALALVPLAASMAVQLPTIIGNTRSFWIPTGLNGARWAIESELIDAVTCNPVLALAALAGLVLLLLRPDARSRATFIDLATLGAGLVLALAVLVAVHLHRPLVINRYLVAIDPIVALILALGAENLTRRLTDRAAVPIDAAMLIATALAIHANCRTTVQQWSWTGTARTIAGLIHDCPTTVVHPDLYWNSEPLGMPPRDNLAVVPFSYAYMARQSGFALAPVGSHTMSRACPTLFWSDHAAAFHPSAATVIRELRQAGYPVTSGRMIRHDIGWVLVTPPASPAPPPTGVRRGQSG